MIGTLIRYVMAAMCGVCVFVLLPPTFWAMGVCLGVTLGLWGLFTWLAWREERKERKEGET